MTSQLKTPKNENDPNIYKDPTKEAEQKNVNCPKNEGHPPKKTTAKIMTTQKRRRPQKLTQPKNEDYPKKKTS